VEHFFAFRPFCSTFAHRYPHRPAPVVTYTPPDCLGALLGMGVPTTSSLARAAVARALKVRPGGAAPAACRSVARHPAAARLGFLVTRGKMEGSSFPRGGGRNAHLREGLSTLAGNGVVLVPSLGRDGGGGRRGRSTAAGRDGGPPSSPTGVFPEDDSAPPPSAPSQTPKASSKTSTATATAAVATAAAAGIGTMATPAAITTDAGAIQARFTVASSSGGMGSVGGVRLGVHSTGAVLVPHPDKADKGGEDACFVLRDHGAFGVMDGVGGWADEGVDPAAYSSMLAEKSAAAVLLGMLDPRAIIADAHANTRIIGSSTACVAVLRQDESAGASGSGSVAPQPGRGGSQVVIGNVGDAGAMVARGATVVFSTPPQQHEFNCPFQLGWKEFYPESDTAEDVETFTVDVLPGDALILGSDGLWDNVPALEVAEVCAAQVAAGKCAQEVAEAIATVAFEHSVDEEYDSPFTQEARRSGYDVEWWEKAAGKELIGGKMDDIAVVVAFLDQEGKCPGPTPAMSGESQSGEAETQAGDSDGHTEEEGKGEGRRTPTGKQPK